MRNDGALDWSGECGGGRRRSDAGYILTGELMEFSDIFDMECERKTRISKIQRHEMSGTVPGITFNPNNVQ